MLNHDSLSETLLEAIAKNLIDIKYLLEKILRRLEVIESKQGYG